MCDVYQSFLFYYVLQDFEHSVVYTDRKAGFAKTPFFDSVERVKNGAKRKRL